MHIITRRRLREFGAAHPEAAPALDAWFAIVRRKSYGSSHEVREDFTTASFLGDYRTVFNIGKQFRLVVDMRYDLGRVYIRHVLTHEEYERRMRRGTL